MAETVAHDDKRPAKSAAAFRTISEVAQELDVPQHVLRFWESRFPQIRPLKRGGGRRYYRPEDVLLLRRIRECLYDEGYTIKGVQRLLREGALKGEPAAPPGLDEATVERQEAVPEGELDLRVRPVSPKLRGVVVEVLDELAQLRDLLRRRGR
jgi:DNA-binding transcriptional MerR regulator